MVRVPNIARRRRVSLPWPVVLLLLPVLLPLGIVLVLIGWTCMGLAALLRLTIRRKT